MLDLTVPMVEVWFSGEKLGEYANDLEALKAASLHADSLPLIAESVEYELRRDTMKYIVHRRIVGPDAPALGPVLTISSTALTVTLDRPASGPTSIDRYELERFNGSAWVQIASGLSIFGATNQYADSSLTSSTGYSYRCRAVDTTERASEYSYSSGTTSAGAANQAPVWASVPTIDINAGSTVDISGYASDPDGDQLEFSKVSSTNPPTMTMSPTGVMGIGTATPAGPQSMDVKASDGLLSANKTINLNVTVAPSGKTVTVPPGDPTYDVAGNGVVGGDTLIVGARADGTRTALKLTNVNGSSGNPIYIKNPSGQATTIRNSSNGSGFRLWIESGHDFVVDGSNGMPAWNRNSPSGKCGFIVTFSNATGADSPTAFVQVSKRCTDFVLKRIEIQGGYSADASRGIGIQVKDGTITRTANPGLYWENIEITQCYINQTGNSGMYIGGNYSANECPMRNVEIHDNAVTNIGQAGLTCKGWWSGTNSIHDNRIDTTGTFIGTPDQRCGISLFSGQASIYNNIILDASVNGTTQSPIGIVCYTQPDGPSESVAVSGYGTFSNFNVTCYNNVVDRSAVYGIRCYRANNSVTPITPFIYNNTVVNSGDLGIYVLEGGSGLVRNNIALGNNGGGTQISSDTTTADNLISGVTVSACFVAPESDNYHLAAERAAVNGAGTDISSTDIEGTSRSGTASKGAYEYA